VFCQRKAKKEKCHEIKAEEEIRLEKKSVETDKDYHHQG
jgi:hypothetical protein